MNEDRSQMSQEDDGPIDHLLRARRPSTQTGAAHDDAVMRAMAASATRIRARRRRRWQMPLSLAAVLVIGVGIGLSVIRDDAPRGEPVRGGQVTKVDPENESVLSAVPAQLSWTPVEGVDRYALKLRDGQGATLWESEPAPGGVAELPEAVRERLGRDGTYLWQLEAETAAGRRVIGNYWFEVRH